MEVREEGMEVQEETVNYGCQKNYGGAGRKSPKTHITVDI